MFDKSIISNESDYRAALADIEPFLQKSFSSLTIEVYESIHYPLPFSTDRK